MKKSLDELILNKSAKEQFSEVLKWIRKEANTSKTSKPGKLLKLNPKLLQ